MKSSFQWTFRKLFFFFTYNATSFNISLAFWERISCFS
ncbi:hypothetical protein Avbf_12346, partial [Armadillidium vulgare]